VKERAIFDAILRETLGQHPEYLGVWTVWEPDALDGRDCDFTHAPGHDKTGRFVPFWHRTGGRIHVEPNVNYDVPGLGDWYFVPMQRRRETVLDPYEVPADGAPVFITSMVAPIFVNGDCCGVTGVDIAMDEFADPQSAPIEQTLRRGFVFLDNQGRVEYWSMRTRELIARYVGRVDDGTLPALLAGHWRRLREKARGLRPMELPVFRRGASSLHIRFIRHPRRGRFVLIVEEQFGAPAPEDALTAREREVWEWLGQGKTNGEIAAILGRSIHTVKRHVERVLAKLGVENRYAAALLSAGTPPPAREVGPSTYILQAGRRL
jgi:DNA-binding CsgD family transcriptional regulator